MDILLDGIDAGKIQLRDKWQFELKSDLFPLSYHRHNIIYQEFYFFLPNALQINEETYTNAQFYKDQTNLIRLKTPTFDFEELLDRENAESPLVRILMLNDYQHTREIEAAVLDEVKLLGTIFHSSLRDRIAQFTNRLDQLSTTDEQKHFELEFSAFCNQIEQFIKEYERISQIALKDWNRKELDWTFAYIEEYIRLSITDYFTGFLNKLRHANENFEILDQRICGIILKQKKDLDNQSEEAITEEPQHEEYVLYRKGLLSKFVIDPLLLDVNRVSVAQRYRNVIGAIPAGVAMLVYLLILFAWAGQGTHFFLGTESLILLTVIIYILKDRIKEELRGLSHQTAAKWFSDYTTQIKSPNDKAVLGTLKESFSFINESKVPKEIIEMRNRHFHSILELFKRPERIIYYKKAVNMHKKPMTMENRFYGLNIIFRLDIHHFLTKAEDPIHTYLRLDSKTLKLRQIQLPRVYHINIILKNTTRLPDGTSRIIWDKYRLVVDKSGIKRIETL